MGAALNLAIIGGAVWAYREGYFDSYLDEAFGTDPIEDLIERMRAAPAPSAPEQAAQTRQMEGTGYDPNVPFFSQNAAPQVSTGSAGGSTEERLLATHWEDVQPWARRNKTWVAAMMWQESRGRTNATSSAGARGLMQVMPGTMGDIVGWGYDKYGDNPDVLYRPGPAIYFGTAYLEYLYGLNSDREWMTRAYNAGPGGERSWGWPSETIDYLAKIKARHETLAGG